MPAYYENTDVHPAKVPEAGNPLAHANYDLDVNREGPTLYQG